MNSLYPFKQAHNYNYPELEPQGENDKFAKRFNEISGKSWVESQTGGMSFEQIMWQMVVELYNKE